MLSAQLRKSSSDIGIYSLELESQISVQVFTKYFLRSVPANKYYTDIFQATTTSRCSPPQIFLGKGVLKICSKFTGERLYRSVISTKLLSNFIEITLWHGFSSVNLLHNFRKPFPRNTSGGLLLHLFSP